MRQHLLIGGKKGKSLINNFVLAAEQSHAAVPAQARVAAVLYERGKFSASSDHLLQMAQRNVAYPEQASTSDIALPAHRFPNFRVIVGPVVIRRGPMQHIAVHV